MPDELVRTRTSDGVRLDGFLQPVSVDSAPHATVDAAVCFSGVGSNFYGSTLIEQLAAGLRSEGITTIRANTRGHDGVSTASTARGGLLQGAAYERVEDCQKDMAAWADFLVTRGYDRIALLGHSLGALKCLYSQVHALHNNVRVVIALSPPWLSYSRFLTSSKAAAFKHSMQRAEVFVREREPETLFQATFPFPLTISAATYVDKYGPAEKYNLMNWVSRIACPVVFTFGSLELEGDNIAFQDIDANLQSLAWTTQRPSVSVIAAANHLYAGQYESVSDVVRTELANVGGNTE